MTEHQNFSRIDVCGLFAKLVVALSRNTASKLDIIIFQALYRYLHPSKCIDIGERKRLFTFWGL